MQRKIRARRKTARPICAFTVAWHRPDQFRKVVSTIGSFTNIMGGHAYPDLIRQDTVTMVVQVNGKVRDRLEVDAGISESDAEVAALASAKVIDALGGATPKRVVVRPPRLVNVVV